MPSRSRRAVAYFWGTNWLLDKFLATNAAMAGEAITRRDTLRSSIRPWLFIFPALLFLTALSDLPGVRDAAALSFFDKFGQNFIGFDNYTWAFDDGIFWQSAFNNLGWLIIVPFFATAFGLIIAVLADRLWWGNIAKSLIFMPMAISFVGASVIWKFVYTYRGPDIEQIGVLNAHRHRRWAFRRRRGSRCRSGTRCC